MKKRFTIIAVLIFVISMALGVCSACGMNKKISITVDEEGIASWSAIEGADFYKYTIYHSLETETEPIGAGFSSTKDTKVRLMPGATIEVSAVRGYGNYVETIAEGKATYKSDALKHANLLENVVKGSVVEEGDLLYFTSKLDDGKEIRMVATDAVYNADGTLTLSNQGTVSSLDSIGQVLVLSAKGEKGENDFNMQFKGGYSFFEKSSVANTTEIDYCGFLYTDHAVSFEDMQPNYFQITFDGTSTNGDMLDEVTLGAIDAYYIDGDLIAVKDFEFNYSFFPEYIAGETYDISMEDGKWNPNDVTASAFRFYLNVTLDSYGSKVGDTNEAVFGTSNYEVGNLKDAKGNVINKTDPLPEGATLEVTVGNMTKDIPIVFSTETVAQTKHELVSAAYVNGVGNVNTLVVPISYVDCEHQKTEENRNKIYAAVGKVMNEDGDVTDYSLGTVEEDNISLSQYFELSSYGKLQMTSFVTDWYEDVYDFSSLQYADVTYEDLENIQLWLFQRYPDMDWSKFDQNADGLFDSVVFIHTGDVFTEEIPIISVQGAYQSFYDYDAENAGTQDSPMFNSFVSINMRYLYGDSFDDALTTNTLIHEYGHQLGLVDYYDVTYSGINAVGEYDMQSSNAGDWNPYSKYAVGWVKPTVVDAASFTSGNSVEFTIRSFSKTGDVLLIPAEGSSYNGTPFDEYIMVDLFTPDGLTQFSADSFNMNNAVGVRIYHINGTQAMRRITTSQGIETVIGTNHYTNAMQEQGLYHVELIQASADNTFTDFSNLRTMIMPEDLFQAGNKFTMSKYREFFWNGLMDDGMEFGYSISVVSITKDENGEYIATIRVTNE